tara:strand:+ start:92 stop:391 length:300 start_codon:yes stop_codon:yes gene_type:complete
MSDKNETMKILISPSSLDEEFVRDEDLETLVNYKLDLVDHPPHYTHGKYETIDVIEDWGLDFHCGNAIKYISRHKYKGQAKKDIGKAIWYLQRYLENLL